MRTLIQYRWLYRDEVTDQLVKTRYWATEEDIRRTHPDAEPIPWSRREIELHDNPLALTAGHLCRGAGQSVND